MKILKKVREMNLPNKMLIATEFPRTLIYVANKTRESDNEDVKKMNKMCRYLAKEWRKQLGVETLKEEGEKQEAKQDNGNSNKEKEPEKIKEEWLLCICFEVFKFFTNRKLENVKSGEEIFNETPVFL